MKDASKVLTEKLQNHGYRLTRARQAIVDCLLTQKHPQTISEIVEAVAADQASVYRTLEVLKQLEIVEEIAVIDGKARYSIGHGHHHHVVCQSCGLIAHVACESITLPKKLPAAFSQITKHEVTFYGDCKNCV